MEYPQCNSEEWGTLKISYHIQLWHEGKHHCPSQRMEPFCACPIMIVFTVPTISTQHGKQSTEKAPMPRVIVASNANFSSNFLNTAAYAHPRKGKTRVQLGQFTTYSTTSVKVA